MQLETLIPFVLMEIPTVTDAAALAALRLSAIDLFTESLSWRTDLTITLDGSENYTFDLPEDTELVEPTSVVVPESGVLPAKTAAQLDISDMNWRTREGSPKYYLLPSFNIIQFVPNPTSGTAYVQVALRPSNTSNAVDDRAGSTFSEELVWGAMYRLFKMKARVWYDPQMATYYQKMAQDGIDRAKNQGANSFAKVNRVVRYGGY